MIYTEVISLFQKVRPNILEAVSKEGGVINFGGKPTAENYRTEIDFLFGFRKTITYHAELLSDLVRLLALDQNLILVPGAFGDPKMVRNGTYGVLVLHIIPFILKGESYIPFGFTGRILENIKSQYSVVAGYDFLFSIPSWSGTQAALAQEYDRYLAITEAKVSETMEIYKVIKSPLIFLESLIQFGKKSARKIIELLCTGSELKSGYDHHVAEDPSFRASFLASRWNEHAHLVELIYDLRRRMEDFVKHPECHERLYEKTLEMIHQGRLVAQRFM